MKNRKTEKQLGRADALSCVPEKNRMVKETVLESGDLILSCPQVYKPFFQKIRSLIGQSSDKTYIRKIELDQLGRDVWEMIDGKKDVNTIVREFADRHSVHVREAEMSVTLFMKSLGEKGLIGIRESD